MIAKNEHRILWLPTEERMWDDDGGGSRNAAGVRIDSSNAHSVAAVFACLRVIAETVASLPLHVLERTPGGGKRIARELPLYRQLHSQPNGWQTSFEWREQACFHIGLWGDAFSELKAGQIVPLHPSRMKVERIENGKIRYKFREDKGTETVYSNEQILQIRGPSDDGINGMSIVEECKDAIALARACELHGARFFAAGARPGFVLSTDGNLNAEARESLRSQWDRRHGGVGNSHNTAVLTGGLKPYEIPQSSNSDAQFLELRRYQLEEIARLFRCPGHLLGIGAGSPQADIEFVQHTILPWLRRFESAFMRDLIEDDNRYLIEFDVRGLLRGDSASRSAYYRAMWDIGVLNTDDIRELENMDPVEGGDVRYRPLNMGTLGEKPTEGDVLAQQQPGSGIDGQAVEGGLAAAAGEPVVPATPGEPVEPEAPQVADVSLNGAQITGLIQIIAQVPAGLLTNEGAAAMIAASFPSIPHSTVQAILAGVAGSQPAQRNCGTGAGGFKPGNKCGGEGESGGSVGGGESGDSWRPSQESTKKYADANAGDTVGGLRVLKDIPNQSSIESSLGDHEIVGVKSVPADALWAPEDAGKIDTYSSSERDRIKKLAAQIKESGEIKPLIVVNNKKDGLYVLEGSHRYEALKYLGVPAVPALIVTDIESFSEDDEKSKSKRSLLSQRSVGRNGRFAKERKGLNPLSESLALTISIDFDRTFAADPALWGEFARKAAADGNTVVMISRRPEEDRATVMETLGDYADAFSQVLLVGGDTLKGDAAQAAGIEVDVWVDDSPQTIRALEQRAEPGTVADGDFVSWDSAGGRARGRVDHVMDYGTLDIPGTDFTIDASKEDPAALITVYEEVAGGWRATDTQVGHKVSTLTKIDTLPQPPPADARKAPRRRKRGG